MLEEIKKQFLEGGVEVRRTAVLGLSGKSTGTGAKESAALLLEALKDSSWRVRKSALDVLFKEYPVEMYVEGLVGLLSLGENAGARNSAIEALVRLGRRAEKYLMAAFETADPDVRKFIVDIIGGSDDKKAVPLLLKALGDTDENVRASTIEHLGMMKDLSAVDPLIEILERGDLWTAYPAAEALGRLGDKRAVPVLVAALKRKPLREPALRALGMIADGSELRHVMPFLEDRSRAVQHEALIALASMCQRGVAAHEMHTALMDRLGDSALDALLRHARSERTEVRSSAILCLGLLKDEKALETLLELSRVEKCREDVKKALLHISTDSPKVLLPFLQTDQVLITRFMCEVMAEVSSGAYRDALTALLENEDGHVRATAARGLARLGGSTAVEQVSRLLADPYEDVQDAAVSALVFMKEFLDEGGLAKMLKNESPLLRKNSARILGAVGASGAVDALGEAMKDGEVEVRHSAFTALCLLDAPDSIQYIMDALADDAPVIRAAAAQKLGEKGREVHSEKLLSLLSDPDDMVKVAAAKALGSVGGRRAVGRLVSLLSDENGFIVTAAIDSLGRLGGDEARIAVQGILSARDAEIRRTAIRALSRFQGAEAAIVPFLRDSDWATRVAAVESLREIAEGPVKDELERAFEAEDDPLVRKVLEEALRV